MFYSMYVQTYDWDDGRLVHPEDVDSRSSHIGSVLQVENLSSAEWLWKIVGLQAATSIETNGSDVCAPLNISIDEHDISDRSIRGKDQLKAVHLHKYEIDKLLLCLLTLSTCARVTVLSCICLSVTVSSFGAQPLQQ